MVGIANDASIAAGCATAFRAAGADLAIAYLNHKAKPFVRPVAEALDASIFCPCDVRILGQNESVFEAISHDWGRPAEGFAQAMDVSCHSFIRMARLAGRLMKEGGSLTTLSFFGAERVVENYNLMGPVRAVLEASVRYLAADLADRNIRVHALSTGPVKTRAASGIDRFDELLDKVRERTPSGRLVSIEEIGRIAAFLATDAGMPLSGSVIYARNGFHTTA